MTKLRLLALSAAAWLACGSATATPAPAGSGDDPDAITLTYRGAKPSVTDFIDAIAGSLGNEEGESECDSWIGAWQSYRRSNKGVGAPYRYTVDAPYGYVRIEWSEGPASGDVGYHEFCLWRCDDGSHKIFAHSSGLITGGKAVETECTGLTFYRYDNNTRRLSYIGLDHAMFGSRPGGDSQIAYLLPRHGKDITYVDGNGTRGIIRWNGNGFTLPLSSAVVQMPVFVTTQPDNSVIAHYWALCDEPQDPDARIGWEAQQAFRTNARAYTRLYLEDGTSSRVTYRAEQLTDPDGKAIWPGVIHYRPGIPNCGAILDPAPGQPEMRASQCGVVVTDDFLACHTPLSIKPRYLSGDDREPLPAALVRALEQRYGMAAEQSALLGVIDGRYTLGALQFKGPWADAPADDIHPGALRCLALDVLADGQEISVRERVGYYESDTDYGWNVDDGGSYAGCLPVAAFRADDGTLMLCYIRPAPESLEVGVCTPQAGGLTDGFSTLFQVMLDEETPVWRTDVLEMQRLYQARNPGEGADTRFTQWAHVCIDYANEWIWATGSEVSDTGAIFLRKDGKLHYIAETGPKRTPSTAIDGDLSYLSIGGPAGGPAWYREVYVFRDGSLVKSCNCLEVMGQIDGCTIDGREADASQARAFLEGIPQLQELNGYFRSIYAE